MATTEPQAPEPLATTDAPDEEQPATPAPDLIRFDRAERWLHWVNAALVLTLLTTGSILYIGPLSTAVGRRLLVKDIHVYSGLLLVVPFALTLAGRWRKGLVADARRLGRWYRDDTRWLRTRHPRYARRKFNAGQKLNAWLVAAALPTMLLTGLVMRFFEPFPDAWRTGATFVHDWTYLVLAVVIVGHILKALTEPVALRSMRTGRVTDAEARRHWPKWWADATRRLR